MTFASKMSMRLTLRVVAALLLVFAAGLSVASLIQSAVLASLCLRTPKTRIYYTKLWAAVFALTEHSARLFQLALPSRSIRSLHSRF